MAKHWVTFFSQTGSEILAVSKALNKEPDLIITNRTDLIGVNDELLTLYKDKFVFIPRKPEMKAYERVIREHEELFKDCLVTLHGYLRVLPAEFCDYAKQNNILLLNGHPAAILLYPELKGFDAQERAWKGGYNDAGSVIHEVTAGVDEGEVLAHREISIEGMTLDEVYCALHDNSVGLWIDYLRELFNK